MVGHDAGGSERGSRVVWGRSADCFPGPAVRTHPSEGVAGGMLFRAAAGP